jgi:cobaltochelatase CobN
MHRPPTTSGPADLEGEALAFLTHPAADLVLLTSAETDLLALARMVERRPFPFRIQGLPLARLNHPAVVDHYLASSLAATRVVVVRLLGGRGHWPYGIDQLRLWQARTPGRQLLLLAGTPEEDGVLGSLSSVGEDLNLSLARCFRIGGEANLVLALGALGTLLEGSTPDPPAPIEAPDPLPHDWRMDPGSRVGVVLYRALRQAGDTALMECLLASLREGGLCPRALWVSSLRDPAIQAGVADWFVQEQVELVLCATAFASVSAAEAGLGAPLWDRLDVPVFQLLTSGAPRERWSDSSVGLGPMDLSLQVVLPELDGRVTTRIGAFREALPHSVEPTTGSTPPLSSLVPDPARLSWVTELLARWLKLRRTPADQRRLALVLANYPNRNGRLANGVGLDTPSSTAGVLHTLHAAGYALGEVEGLPVDGAALMAQILGGRTNDPESDHRPALDWLPLEIYRAWYDGLPSAGRQIMEQTWGLPDDDAALSQGPKGRGFPIPGLRFGSVVVLIQPSRGYDRDPSRTYHSPDLPPPHAYLATYLWIRQLQDAHAVVHVGKHGNLEWLPGKGVGLSDCCFPEWALGPMPHLYPFIVNDPGEGSQAKRRSQAVILDHLTPPLGRAGLEGNLQRLEALLDEYWLAQELGSERTELLRSQLEGLLAALELPSPSTSPASLSPTDADISEVLVRRCDPLEARLEAADGYLCELKEAQIRLGLHIYGQLPEGEALAELLLALARAPQEHHPGLTQALAQDLGLELDPWTDLEEDLLAPKDRHRLQTWQPAASQGLRRVGDGVALLEAEALAWMRTLLGVEGPGPTQSQGQALALALQRVREQLMPNLLACGQAEQAALLKGLAGRRIPAGPSGAPTRGRPEVLPTGRNFFSVDLRGLPTEAAWDLGRRSAEQLLATYLMEEGEDLRSLALSVWGTATMRNGGEDIAQALALMGVRPQWDGPSRRLVALEVVPARALGRPRVDVTLRISGLFRDAFPQLVNWFNRACRLVAALPEEDDVNPLAALARSDGQWGRVYGSAPGAYGAGLQALIDSGGWEDRSDLADAFLAWSSWRYDSEGPDPTSAVVARPDRKGLVERLTSVQVVLHNQDNREHDLLDSDDYYQFQGGLSAAVERVRGQRPGLWFGDHSRPQRPRVHRLEKEFDKVIRSRLLNARWLEGMQRHGYKGGFEMAASLDYLFAYDASTGRVPDWSYGAICDRWLRAADTLEFLRKANPWALRDMAERLLEAHNRGLWEGSTEEQLSHLRDLVLASEALIETGPAS